jgi:hypothetical protein
MHLTSWDMSALGLPVQDNLAAHVKLVEGMYTSPRVLQPGELPALASSFFVTSAFATQGAREAQLASARLASMLTGRFRHTGMSNFDVSNTHVSGQSRREVDVSLLMH